MRRATLLVAAVIAATPLASNSAELSNCRVVDPEGVDLGSYPEHPWSPYESVRNHDVVFLGEVVVPSKRCSLGWCAGVKVLQTVKGNPGPTVLLHVDSPSDNPCGPTHFLSKGGRWVVFANEGTSHGGLKYFRAADEGPSFAANQVPDFDLLEGRYRMLRAQLDRAISERLDDRGAKVR